MYESAREIFSEFVRCAGGPRAKIAFVVSASGKDPDDTFRSYVKDFEELGVKAGNCVLVPLYPEGVVDERGFANSDGDHDSLPGLLEGVSGVWFTGGDQYHTAKCLLRPDGTCTRALEILHHIYRQGGVVGGTSAGAAIMGKVMIGGGNNRGVLHHDVVFGYDRYQEIEERNDPVSPLILAQGLGFFPGGIVDQHFNARPRLLRTVEACLSNPEGVRVGYGVSEDTALVYQDGSMSVLGSAGVYVVDCRNAVKLGKGCYEGVVLHAIHKGDCIRSGAIRLACDAPSGSPSYPPRDYVCGAIVGNPGFCDFVDTHVLRAHRDSMYFSEEQESFYAKGVVVHEAYGRTYGVALRYYRTQRTKGYRRAHTSFKDVELSVRTREIRL